MSAVKESIMLMGELGYVPVSKEDQYRWQGVLDRLLPVTGVAIEVRGRQIVENGLPAAEARAVAADQRIDARDRDTLQFLLEVAGLEDEASSVAWWIGRRGQSERRCAACGCVGQPNFFVSTGAETLCVDCG
jgi:hypothetical protein